MNKIMNEGQILAELLVAISIVVVVVAFGAQLMSVSFQASKYSKERGNALRLAQEAIEAMRAIGYGNDSTTQGWNRIYKPPDGSGDPSTSKGANKPYYPVVSTSTPVKWILFTGTETITFSGGEAYTRKVIIDNVSRDASGNIESTYNASNDDPGTQKVTVTVSRTGASDTTLVDYFTRFVNDSGPQTGWEGVQSCVSTGATSSPNTYCSCSPANSLSRTGGSFTLSASGSCSL